MDTFYTILYSIGGICVLLIAGLAIFIGTTSHKNSQDTVINWITNPVSNKRKRRERN